MGRKLSPQEEAVVLSDLIRQAHEAMQGLRDVIRTADAITPNLVAQYEASHHREIKQLSNHLFEQSNRVAADLNTQIEQARVMITDQIMAGEAIFDRHTSTVIIKFGPGAFDDQQPLPYPEVTPKERDQ